MDFAIALFGSWLAGTVDDSAKEVRMRSLALLSLFMGGMLLAAQPETKINKVPVQPTAADSGKEMFNAYCASCHGSEGKGNGPAAAALKPEPTDLTQLAKKNGGKFPALVVLSALKDGTPGAHGSKDMPVWGPILQSVTPNGGPAVQMRLSNLTDYVGSLQAK